MIDQLAEKLSVFLPEGTEHLCARWLMDHQVQLRISPPRKTKLGDFRPAHARQPHRISVNNDLVPLQFLITFAHEIAHVVNWDHHGRSVKAHGPEWKQFYRERLHELLALGALDEQTQVVLGRHSLNPGASSYGDTELQNLTPDTPDQSETLNALTPHTVFELESGKTFRTIKKLRKYWLCEEINSQKKYRVLGTVKVTVKERTTRF